MKWNKLYNYPPSTRSTTDGLRIYEIGEEKLPSVTTILQATQSQEKIDSLKKQQEQTRELFIKLQGAIEVLEDMDKEDSKDKKNKK